MSFGWCQAALQRFRLAFWGRRTTVLRVGFALVLVPLASSLFQAYRIQESFSKEIAQIYHSHVAQDELLSRLRRTLWLAANVTRDYLINPGPASLRMFREQSAKLCADSAKLILELDQLPPPRRPSAELIQSVDEFWALIAGVPQSTRALDPAGRYAFVQREIVPRRNSISELLHQFVRAGQDGLKESESEFRRTRWASAQRLFLVLGLSLICSLAAAGFSVMHVENLERRSLDQYRQVERAREELQQLSARLMQAQEEERVRLSRELHDEIGQVIATLRLEITRAESLPVNQFADVRERLARARDLATRAVQTVRDVCVLLRPAMLDDLGLIPALQWQVEDFARRTGVPCELHEEALSEVLPDPIKTCVYRVLQESLYNAEKHSAASKVMVTVRQSPEALVMEIEDNGCGFEVERQRQAALPAHFGILGMRERAACLGGAFEIHSHPGKGTRIRLRLPMGGTIPAKGTLLEVPA